MEQTGAPEGPAGPGMGDPPAQPPASPPPAAPPVPEGDYPLTFSVDYPDRPLNRLTTGLRIFTVIPILIVLATLGGGNGWAGVALAGILFFPTLLMIVFRRKYPRWWYDWNLQFLRFSNRVAAYLALMDDRYPSTDEQQSVHLDFPYPDVERDLNRWLPLIKWFLAIPHYIVLFVLWILAFVCVVIAWFAILFTGRYPEGLFNIVESVLRWGNRVTAYAFLLITDRYPPFSFS
jgi:hypothetical protein